MASPLQSESPSRSQPPSRRQSPSRIQPPSQGESPSRTVLLGNTSRSSSSSSTSLNDTGRHIYEPVSPTLLEGVESQEDPEEALNAVIAETNSLLGLREVKEHFLDLRDSVQLHRVQGADPRQERFHIIFQGNPGTGKTTVARLYAKLLRALNVLESDTVKETSGAQLASIGPQKTREMLRSIGITNNDSDDDLTNGNIFFSSPGLRPRHFRPSGGVLFVDEAYQLTAPHVSNGGRQALNIILTDMENNIGKLVVIFAGYNEELEAFFGHNRGLKSRIPYTLHFEDFGEKELLSILQTRIQERFNGRMVVEGGLDGKYMRVAVRRLSRARGTKGFGNARAAEILLQQIHRRQARRLKTHLNPTSDLIFFFSMEDLVGPSPSHVRRHSVAWVELQKLTGLDAVKKSIEATIDSIEWNYERELEEDEPIAFSLNRVFVGSPGTGKTTVARLYGQILADLGLLSNGTVVIKKPPDFIGDAVGKSEANTKAILASTEGKVLIIDEAYMLDPGDSTRQQESYKSAVLDTLVGEVQSVPGDDRCVILLGYEDKLQAMFQNANPGLPGRFATDDPFYFDDFSPEQLQQVLREKMRNQNLHYAPEALEVATDVLNRARLRPTFSNGREVDNLLNAAKSRYVARKTKAPAERCSSRVVFQAQDFDQNFCRDKRDVRSCGDVLRGGVSEEVISKLESCQTV